MTRSKKIMFAGIFSAALLTVLGSPATAGNYITLLPYQYVWVNGDVGKFRAHNWSADGYIGGLKALSIEEDLGKDVLMSFDGHAINGENDYGAHLNLEKDGFAAFDVDYETFRKYYDGTGGVYPAFTTYKVVEGGNDLHMDMEHFKFSVAPEMDSLHDLNFAYEHHSKEGTKSRLTWTGIKEGSITKNIGPSWQRISEATDSLSLQGKTAVLGFDVTARQIVESTRIKSLREEKNLTTGSTAADSKVRQHFQDPKSDVFATSFSGEKWYNDDKSYLSTAYRFHKVYADELENIREYSANGTPTNYSSAKTRINARAENEMMGHTWLGNYMKKISNFFTVSAKLKTEYIKRDGESEYPYDASPATPDGIIEALDYSESTNTILSWAQNFGFRFTGIPKLSLFGDVELNQTKNNIKEQQQNIRRVPQWERQTITYINREVWTMGSRYAFNKDINFTAQVRHRNENNDYDDKDDTAGAINSAFFDALSFKSNELNTRLGWNLTDRMQTGFRYQLSDNNIISRVQTQKEQEAKVLSHTFTYDVMLQPVDKLALNASFSMQDAKTSTAAAAASTAALPGFNADVSTIFLGASYAVNESFSYSGSGAYSWSDNYNEFYYDGLPLGVSNTRFNLEAGLKWKPTKKDITLEPHYAYYNYETNPTAEVGDYSAHVAWLDCNLTW